jgi:hypothetical protein
MVATNSPQEAGSDLARYQDKDGYALLHLLEQLIAAAKPQLRYLPDFEPLGKLHDQTFNNVHSYWSGYAGEPKQAEANYGNGLDDRVRCAVLATVYEHDEKDPESRSAGTNVCILTKEELLLTQQGHLVLRRTVIKRDVTGRGWRSAHLRVDDFEIADQGWVRDRFKTNWTFARNAIEKLRYLVYKSITKREKRLDTMKTLRSKLAELVGMPDPYDAPDPVLAAGIDTSGLRPAEHERGLGFIK